MHVYIKSSYQFTRITTLAHRNQIHQHTRISYITSPHQSFVRAHYTSPQSAFTSSRDAPRPKEQMHNLTIAAHQSTSSFLLFLLCAWRRPSSRVATEEDALRATTPASVQLGGDQETEAIVCVCVCHPQLFPFICARVMCLYLYIGTLAPCKLLKRRVSCERCGRAVRDGHRHRARLEIDEGIWDSWKSNCAHRPHYRPKVYGHSHRAIQ